jgi:hypothetical protein
MKGTAVTPADASDGVAWLTTSQLLAAHARSLEADQNRFLTDEFLASLDPIGIHVVGFAMWHVNYAGTRGIRTHLLCKTRGKLEPVDVFFDFMVDDYMALPSTWPPVSTAGGRAA